MEVLIALSLIVLGLGLIAVEIYVIPGFNITGILGFLVTVFAVGYAFSAAGWVGGVTAVVLALLLGGTMGYVMWKSGALEQFVLAADLMRTQEGDDREQEHRARCLGRAGVAITPLRPTGVAQIDGDRVEVVTEGGFIAAGSKIRVVAMDRRRFFVRLDDSSPTVVQSDGQ